MKVRGYEPADAVRITEIYNGYIDTSHATFELERIDVKEMCRRIGDTVAGGYPFLVCEMDGAAAGYAYGRAFRPRPGYRSTIEVAVYVGPDFCGNGVGTALYTDLFDSLRRNEYHSAIATIALPNDASVRLHENFGFEKAGHFKEAGFKFERWIDVGYWQLMLG